MRQHLRASALVFLVLCTSVLIMFLPSFSLKGISHMPLHQELRFELILDGEKELELILFGYAGCTDVCTPRLEQLAAWYTRLPEQTRSRLGVKFLDLSLPQDRSLPDSFAKAFHQNFEGRPLEAGTMREYTKAFKVYFANSLLNAYEIDHTAHLYLARKSPKGKELRFVYASFPYDFTQIDSDIQELLNE